MTWVPIGLSSAALTHPGRVRAHNEDAVLADDRRGLWAVADGMGGHAGGAAASATVIERLGAVRGHWTTARALAADVIGRIEDAHAAIRRRTAETGGGTAGSTVVCLAVHGVHALVAWCGDSRVYRLRPRGALLRLTRDHSVVQGLIDAGQLTEAEAETHPQAHVLTRAVGATEDLALDFAQVDLRSGDRFLLCSDGLTRPLPEGDLAELLSGLRHPQAVCDALLDRVLAQGAPDNISIVVVDVG